MRKRRPPVAPPAWTSAEVLTDPFLFTWSVVKPGADTAPDEDSWYQWAESELDGKLRLYPRINASTGTLRYVPALGLFREFASTAATPEGIRAFASRRGDLFGEWPIEETGISERRLVGGTTLTRWLAKLQDVQSLVTLLDQIQDKRRHPELRAIIKHTGSELAYEKGNAWWLIASGESLKNFPKNDVVRPARAVLARELNRRLADLETPSYVIPQLACTPDLQQRIVFRPCNLLAEMYVRMAQTVSGEFGLKKCANIACGEYFQVGLGGKRSDKDTCSLKCRKQKSRASKCI